MKRTQMMINEGEEQIKKGRDIERSQPPAGVTCTRASLEHARDIRFS